MSSGYIFMAPTDCPGAGPYIFDKLGHMIWDGTGVVGPATAYNLHACNYQSSPHLCLHLGDRMNGYSLGHAVILDSNYQIVATVQTGGGINAADQHEFQLVEGGTHAILTSYRAIPYDLSAAPYSVTQQQGWVMDGIFQEINIATGEVVFEWHSEDHVSIDQTRIMPHSFAQSGDGYSEYSAFDYFHINSVDKSTTSKYYLVSSRHTSTIYAIDPNKWDPVWRLACPGSGPTAWSDFTCDCFNFSSQHDARWVSESDGHTTISLFDNGANGVAANLTSAVSSGMIIDLDHTTGKATLRSQAFPPRTDLSAQSQGNFQALENGRYFTGYGIGSAFSEHFVNAQGKFELGYYAEFSIPTDPGPVASYRGFSSDWTSTPATTVPALFVYAHNASAPNALYVSWNGATTVTRWHFWASTTKTGTFTEIGNAEKADFETAWLSPRYYPFWRVDATDSTGKVLRSSEITGTWMPGAELARVCGGVGCPVRAQSWVDTAIATATSVPPPPQATQIQIG